MERWVTTWMDDPLHAGAWSPAPYAENLWVGPWWSYCRTHLVEELLDEIHAARPRRLVTSGSDAAATAAVAEKLPAGTVWWSTNAEAGSDRLHGIPLGFVWDAGRHAAMVEAAQVPRCRRKSLYVCHTEYPRGAPGHAPRAGVAERFRDWEDATVEGGHGAWDVPAGRYYAGLREHEFVLAPAGAGVDTHRIWEALALGCRPIVLRDQVHRGWSGLPVVWVDRWDDVTPELLAEEGEAGKEFEGVELAELTAAYWLGKVVL